MGQGQSPIDISDYVEADSPSPRFEYGSAAVLIEHQQVAPIVHFNPDNQLFIAEERFELLQFHWHTPAEHTIDGDEFVMELHLVHQNDRRALLVAGMVTLFAVGSSTVGMAEEYMPFVPLLVTMCLALRMDAVVGLGILHVGAGVGGRRTPTWRRAAWRAERECASAPRSRAR